LLETKINGVHHSQHMRQVSIDDEELCDGVRACVPACVRACARARVRGDDSSGALHFFNSRVLKSQNAKALTCRQSKPLHSIEN